MRSVIPDHFKIVTVSGLHSNIGKTLLSERLLSMLAHAAAIKMTTSDFKTFVTDAANKIMVRGKDTWRLKQSGAEKVVWVMAEEKDTLDAFKQSLTLVAGHEQLLVEGNSILEYIDPLLSFFICDDRVLNAGRVKPSRKTALKKAHVVVYNLRAGSPGRVEDVRAFCKAMNPDADFYSMNLTAADICRKILTPVLEQYSLVVTG